MNKNVTWSHGVPQVSCLNPAHSILIPNGLRDDLLSFLLRDYVFVQSLHELRGSPHTVLLKIVSHLCEDLVLLLLCQPRQLKESLKSFIRLV